MKKKIQIMKTDKYFMITVTLGIAGIFSAGYMWNDGLWWQSIIFLLTSIFTLGYLPERGIL